MIKLKLIKFCDLNKYFSSQFMNKLNSNNVPNLFNYYFTTDNSFHDHNTPSNKDFHEPKMEMIMKNQLYSALVVCCEC